MRDGKYVIIHVDDSQTAREMVKEALTLAGFEVHSADDAQDLEQRVLLNEALREDVDLFIFDMEMPDLMGAQLAAIMDVVYEELANVPFIIYSGKEKDWVTKMSQDAAELSAAFKRNYRGYLGKDLGGEEKLADLVSKVLALEKK